VVTLTVLDKGYVELVKYMTNEEDLLEILAICKVTSSWSST